MDMLLSDQSEVSKKMKAWP